MGFWNLASIVTFDLENFVRNKSVEENIGLLLKNSINIIDLFYLFIIAIKPISLLCFHVAIVVATMDTNSRMHDDCVKFINIGCLTLLWKILVNVMGNKGSQIKLFWKRYKLVYFPSKSIKSHEMNY